MGKNRKTSYGKYQKNLPDASKKDHCEKCSASEVVIDTHRIKPGVSGGLYVSGNVISLCRSCHRKEHDRMKKEKYEKEFGFRMEKSVSCLVSKEMRYSLKRLAIEIEVPFQKLIAKILFDFLNDNDHWKKL